MGRDVQMLLNWVSSRAAICHNETIPKEGGGGLVRMTGPIFRKLVRKLMLPTDLVEKWVADLVEHRSHRYGAARRISP